MKRRLLLAGTAGLPIAHAAAPALRVVGPAEAMDYRYDFLLRLLALWLPAAGLPSELDLQPQASQIATLQALQQGQLDIGLVASVGPFPSGVWPLRIPLRRGLLGVRLLLARKAMAPRLAQLRQASELKRWRMGYGADWGDRAQFESLGYRVQPVDTYPALFRALAAGEVDYLHRGVNEIWGEVDHPLLVPHGLVIVPDIALSYPLDDYLCVGEARRAWLPQLQAGFERLWQQGRYQALFQATFGRALRRAGLGARRVLPVIGYGTDPQTPLPAFDALRLRPARLEAGP